MYYSCHCIKRNGLQHDCRRTGCGGEPACLTLPDPVCAPSQLARARGLADPGPLASHYQAQAGRPAGPSGGASGSGTGSGRKFIVCELKGMSTDGPAPGSSSGKCCKCSPHTSNNIPAQSAGVGKYIGNACLYAPPPTPASQAQHTEKSRCPCPNDASRYKQQSDKSHCPCSTRGSRYDQSIVFNQRIILQERSPKANKGGVGERSQQKIVPVKKEEPCTRPGCIHWQPPSPCVWDLPCKADCFETPPGIQPGRNPLTYGGGAFVTTVPNNASHKSYNETSHQARETPKLLTPVSHTGCCCTSREGGAPAAGGVAPEGMPVLLMKLC